MFTFAARTHRGNVYEVNEDYIGHDESVGLWLVADGMGGHAAGEVASEIATNTVVARVQAGTPLKQALVDAHNAVQQEAIRVQKFRGMGSTCVAMQIAKGWAEVVWVGDSRAYLWRGGRLRQLSKDHSFMQMLIDHNRLSEEDARKHPKRNVVTQVLGFESPEPDVVSERLRRGDWLLLCSDGLNEEMTDAEIGEYLARDVDVETATDQLIEQACNLGGRDNISAIIVQYDGEDGLDDDDQTTQVQAVVKPLSPQPVEAPKRRLSWRVFLLGAGAAILLSALFIWVMGRI